MNYEDILYGVKDNVAWITLNMPQKHNRLNSRTIQEVLGALEKAKDDEKVRVIVITGAGDRAFCAGVDINEFTGSTTMGYRRIYSGYARLCLVFSTLGKPSIAAINGLALGGGCGLAIYPDISIASENARFATPEVNVGIWPMMVSAMLSRTVGRKKALEMMLTGDMLDAQEAERIGLINKVVPADKLEESVTELADKIKGKSPTVIKLGLDAFYGMSDLEYSKALGYLRDMVVLLLSTEDSQEGVKAFLEKRQPVWKGR